MKTIFYERMILMRDFNYDLMACCVDGNLWGVKDALAHGADINATDQHGHTALMFAMKNDKQDIVTYLLSKGADTTPVAQDGFTAKDHLPKAGSLNRMSLGAATR